MHQDTKKPEMHCFGFNKNLYVTLVKELKDIESLAFSSKY